MKRIALWLVLLLPYIGGFMLYLWFNRSLKEVANASVIIISKQEMSLRVIDYRGIELLNMPVAIGLNNGDKQKLGDMRTPEGVFAISQIQDASGWSHDFGDGKGEIRGAYGQFFIRLSTGFQGIGIHGTHDDQSIGTRVTEGCIRLKNEDLEELVKNIKVGNVVIITPSTLDIINNM